MSYFCKHIWPHVMRYAFREIPPFLHGIFTNYRHSGFYSLTGKAASLLMWISHSSCNEYGSLFTVIFQRNAAAPYPRPDGNEDRGAARLFLLFCVGKKQEDSAYIRRKFPPA